MASKELDEHFKICKVCGVNKKRIRNGAFRRKGRGKTPRWKGEDGRSWNGQCCPDCHCKRASVTNFNRTIVNDVEPTSKS